MPKLRNASTELGMFAQWIARKCRNHHPLEELSPRKTGGVYLIKAGERQKLEQKERMPNTYKARSHGQVWTFADDEATVLYEAGGRAFTIKVEEVDPETVKHRERVPVSY